MEILVSVTFYVISLFTNVASNTSLHDLFKKKIHKKIYMSQAYNKYWASVATHTYTGEW